jgi:hypothetical protein
MAKNEGINVKMELWKKAHELESKAMEAGDSTACDKAKKCKMLFEGDLLSDNENERKVVTSNAIHEGVVLEEQPQTNGAVLGKGLSALMNGGAQQ